MSLQVMLAALAALLAILKAGEPLLCVYWLTVCAYWVLNEINRRNQT